MYLVAMHSETSPSKPFVSGPVIGMYRGMPIYEFICDGDRLLTYDRLVVVYANGDISLNQFEDDVMMISPGLVYRGDGTGAHSITG